MNKQELLAALKEALTGRPKHPETDTHAATDAEYRAYDEDLNEWLEGLEADVSSVVSQAEAEAPDIDLGPWTERTLVVSTAHWPGPEAAEAMKDCPAVLCKVTHYGARVLVADLDPTTLGELPEPVAAILKEAHAQGFRWVDFDVDADVCPAFPSFDW